MDIREQLPKLVPSFLSDDKRYSIFVDMAAEEFGIIQDYIQMFKDLQDVEYTPSKFLEGLSKLIDMPYLETVDVEVQRQVLQRAFHVHESRGDEESMVMMATHADNSGYLGGKLFIPGTYKERNLATIVFARDMLYTWSKSTYSGPDRRVDSDVYQEGIIEIIVDPVTPTVKSRTESIKPAGLKIKFRYLVPIFLDKGLNNKHYFENSISIEKYIPWTLARPRTTWSGYNNKRSGTFFHSSQEQSLFEMGIRLDIKTTGFRDGKIWSPIPHFYSYHNPSIYDKMNKGDWEYQYPVQIRKSYNSKEYEYSNKLKHGGRGHRSGSFCNEHTILQPYVRNPKLINSVFTIEEIKDNLLNDKNRLEKQLEYRFTTEGIIEQKSNLRSSYDTSNNPLIDKEFMSKYGDIPIDLLDRTEKASVNVIQSNIGRVISKSDYNRPTIVFMGVVQSRTVESINRVTSEYKPLQGSFTEVIEEEIPASNYHYSRGLEHSEQGERSGEK